MHQSYYFPMEINPIKSFYFSAQKLDLFYLDSQDKTNTYQTKVWKREKTKIFFHFPLNANVTLFSLSIIFTFIFLQNLHKTIIKVQENLHSSPYNCLSCHQPDTKVDFELQNPKSKVKTSNQYFQSLDFLPMSIYQVFLVHSNLWVL